MYNLNTNNLIVYTVLDLKLFDKEFRSTQLVFSYQGGKKVSELLPPIWYSLTVYCYIYYTNALNICYVNGEEGSYSVCGIRP